MPPPKRESRLNRISRRAVIAARRRTAETRQGLDLRGADSTLMLSALRYSEAFRPLMAAAVERRCVALFGGSRQTRMKLARALYNSLELPGEFVAPLHILGRPQLIGGGRWRKPGALDQAANGMLFLNSIGKFNKDAVDVIVDGAAKRGALVVTGADGCWCQPSMRPCRCTDRQKVVYEAYVRTLARRLDAVSVDAPDKLRLALGHAGSNEERIRALIRAGGRIDAKGGTT